MSDVDVPPPYRLVGDEAERATFPGGAVVQVVAGDPGATELTVAEVHPATVVVTTDRLLAVEGDLEWEWYLDDVEALHHGDEEAWTIVVVPGVGDHGVAVAPGQVEEFRRLLGEGPQAPVATNGHRAETAVPPLLGADPVVAPDPAPAGTTNGTPDGDAGGDGDRLVLDGAADLAPWWAAAAGPATEPDVPVIGAVAALDGDGAELAEHAGRMRTLRTRLAKVRTRAGHAAAPAPPATLATLEAREISAWFGNHHVLDRVSLTMPAGQVTALIGPSGCGKSTFLRILNRMHEMIASASLSGEVLLDGEDVYDVDKKLADARRYIGMVFQKPNPFPAMSIYDNVVASFRLTGLKMSADAKDEVVESCLTKAGLWTEVRDRLRMPGGGLSGGQQQRLCIARALAIRPRVLLMDEPCSALDPTSTRRIEQTITELASEVTIVIVTHNMQQAARVSNQCAFFLAEAGTPGVIVEHGPTELMFGSPQDERTNDYVNGRFG